MQSVVSFIFSIPTAILFLLLFLSPAVSAEGVRTCKVKEVLKGGMYVYILCQENDKNIWLATVAREFKTDELVSFLDVPPMINFYSKQLDRTFPEIILMDNLPPAGSKK